MSADSIGAGRDVPRQAYGDATAGTPIRLKRVRAAAARRGIPLAMIITTVAVVVLPSPARPPCRSSPGNPGRPPRRVGHSAASPGRARFPPTPLSTHLSRKVAEYEPQQ